MYAIFTGAETSSYMIPLMVRTTRYLRKTGPSVELQVPNGEPDLESDDSFGGEGSTMIFSQPYTGNFWEDEMPDHEIRR
jgi:hypothetical protein